MRKFLAFVVIAYLLAIANSQNDIDDIYKKYKFVFNTGDLGDHTREEESDGSGHVTGMYSYLDPNGILRTVRYNSAPGAGYQAYGDGIPQIGAVLLKAEKHDISLDGLKDSNMMDEEIVNRNQNAELVNIMQDVELINKMQYSGHVNNTQDTELDNKIQGEVIVNKMQDAELVNKIKGAERVNKMQDAELVNKNHTYKDTNVTTIVLNSTDGVAKEYLQQNESSQESSAVIGDDLNAGSTKGSFSSMVVNHGGIVPFIFPHNPYRQPMNFGPFLYALPSPFTYNFATPHYLLL